MLTGHRKDQTLQMIVQAISSIDQKIDQVLLKESRPGSSAPRYTGSTAISPFNIPHRKILGEGNKILSWPAIQELLDGNLSHLSRWEGVPTPSEMWLVQVTERFNHPLPIDERVHFSIGPKLSETAGSFVLTEEYITELCEAYFSLFHCMYPIIDRDYYYAELLPRVCRDSFDESDEASGLVLMVLALGMVAQESMLGEPLPEQPGGRPTGIKGGTIESLPGCLFVSEAKRRMGLMLTRYNLTVLHSHILAA